MLDVSVLVSQVTELEAASARMETEAQELVASRAPLEAQRQQLLECGHLDPDMAVLSQH